MAAADVQGCDPDPVELEPGFRALGADLESGRWPRERRDLLELAELDAGYPLVVDDL